MAPEYTPEQLAQIKQDRIKDTIFNLRGQLSPLVDQAALYRKNYTDAKTNVKRQYFKKKMKKIQADIVNMLVMINKFEGIQTHTEPRLVGQESAE